jgi:hypothetical protein
MRSAGEMPLLDLSCHDLQDISLVILTIIMKLMTSLIFRYYPM